MIQARLYRLPAGTPCGFILSGHAGAAAYGKDVVCAAVSVLAINTANAVEALTAAPFSVEAGEEGGRMAFWLKAPDEQAALLLEALFLGLHALKDQYSEFITLKEEVRTCFN